MPFLSKTGDNPNLVPAALQFSTQAERQFLQAANQRPKFRNDKCDFQNFAGTTQLFSKQAGYVLHQHRMDIVVIENGTGKLIGGFRKFEPKTWLGIQTGEL
jgi:hypothetical protein